MREALFGIIALLILGIIGEMDYRDEQIARAEFAAMDPTR